MNRDRIYAAELAHDTSGASDREVEACLGEAMDDLVWRLFNGEKIGYPKWGLHDALQEMDDCHELLAKAVIRSTPLALAEIDGEIERRIRASLDNTETLHDRAAAIANERGERE